MMTLKDIKTASTVELYHYLVAYAEVFDLEKHCEGIRRACIKKMQYIVNGTQQSSNK